MIYEVNLKLDAGIATDFESWLGEHIGQMLELPGFREAVRLEREDDGDPASAANVFLWTIQYLLYDRRDLETYPREHADRM